MPYSLTEEQNALQDSLRSFCDSRITSEYLRTCIDGAGDSAVGLWQELQSLGLHEYFSGGDPDFTPGFRELGIVAYECGRALLPVPLSDALFAGPWLFARILADSEKKKAHAFLGAEIVRNVLQGKTQPAAGECPRFITAADSASFVLLCLNGSLSVVREFKTESETPLDVTRKYGKIQYTPAGALTFEGETALRAGAMLQALRAMEIAGAAGRVLEMTIEHVKTRKQFDVPVGGFQALQHALADMHVSAESLKNLAQFACWAADDSPEQLRLAGLAALRHACLAAPALIEKAIQAHGGIGFTWEYDLHLYLRRVQTLAAVSAAASDHTAIFDLL